MSDEFPYSHYNDAEKINMFKNLEQYDIKIIKKTKLKYLPVVNINIPLIMFLYKFNDIQFLEKELMDIANIEPLSRMFLYNCVAMCSFGKYDSPYDFFIKYKEKIYSELDKNNIEKTNKNIFKYIYTHTRECSGHNPGIIKKFIKKYNAKKVLDMSAGWGDRLLGCIASGIDHYLSTDPNDCVHDGYNSMLKLLLPNSLNPNGVYNIYKHGFEQLDLSTYKNYFDIVYTSPPYFDYEKYTPNNTNQSYILFSSEIIWLDSFLKPSILKMIYAIKNNGYLILYLTQQKGKKYMEKLFEWIKDIENIYYIGCIFFGIHNIYKRKGRNVAHPIFIFKKCNKCPSKLYNSSPTLFIDKNSKLNIIKDNILTGSVITRVMFLYIKSIINDKINDDIIKIYYDVIDCKKHNDLIILSISYCLYILKYNKVELIINTQNPKNIKYYNTILFFHKNTIITNIPFDNTIHIQIRYLFDIQEYYDLLYISLNTVTKKYNNVKRLWIYFDYIGHILLTSLSKIFTKTIYLCVRDVKYNTILNNTKSTFFYDNPNNLNFIEFAALHSLYDDYVWDTDHNYFIDLLNN
jgi:hypothetical protein